MYVVTIQVNGHIALMMSSLDRHRAVDLLDEHFERLRASVGPGVSVHAELWDIGAAHKGLARTSCRVRTQAGRVVRTSTLEGVAGALVRVHA